MENKAKDYGTTIRSLDEVFKIVGDQLTANDVRVLKLIFAGTFTPDFLGEIRDGASFLQALEKIDRVDESNFKNVQNYLKMINRHDLLQFLSLTKRKTVSPDPVTEYLEQCAKTNTITPFSRQSETPEPDKPTEAETVETEEKASPGKSTAHVKPKNKKRRQDTTPEDSTAATPQKKLKPCDSCTSDTTPSNSPSPANKSRKSASPGSSHGNTPVPRRRSERLKRCVCDDVSSPSGDLGTTNSPAVVTDSSPVSVSDPLPAASVTDALKKKVTCDIRLRVRAEYVNHETALQGNIHSNKPERIERQFERFMQANTILKSRDLGSIICDIKFSELTYLDAFWRDYINGSLLEALKGVFITESLKQAVGHEAIKLLVNVDEDDYEAGRLVLLESLKNAP